MKNFVKKRRIKTITIVLISMLLFALLLLVTGKFNPIPVKESKSENEVWDIAAPTFSAESGFYTDPFKLEIDVPEGTNVYYTLDCSDPDVNSELYDAPIYLDDATKHENVYSMRTDVSTGFYSDLIEKYQTIDKDPQYMAPDFLVEKCNVVRAVAIDAEGHKSGIITRIYFIGQSEKIDGANVVAVTTDPNNLFDNEKGIYVTGKVFDNYISRGQLAVHWRFWDANYRQHGKNWERDASISFFDKSGKLFYDQQYAGIRVQGGISRGTVPRSLNLYAKNQSGKKDYFDYELFDSNYIPHAVTLACGGDMLWTKFNDYMMSERCGDLNFATMNYEPYVLFLDGEYWGFYWLAEKYDEFYISHYYNIDKNNICMIKNEKVECGDDSALALYNKMKYEITNRDLSVQSEYEYACSIIDVDSFIDYFAVMAYISRQEDWPSRNVALWRSVQSSGDGYSDGKWRWMLFDCNSVSMTADIVKDNSLEYIISNDELFASFWRNADFRKQFKARILHIADTCFDANEMEAFINKYDAEWKAALYKSWTRFHGGQNSKIIEYENDMNGYRVFFSNRKEIVESWF